MKSQNKAKANKKKLGRPKAEHPLQRYNVSLDPVVIKKAKELIFGMQLSPIMNKLLRIWIKHTKEVNFMMNNLEEMKYE